MLAVIPNAVRNLLLRAARNLLLLFKGRWVIPTGLVVCALFLAMCHGGRSATPIPEPIARHIEQHQIQSAIDSAAIKRLTTSAVSVRIKADTASHRAERAASSGDYERAYALQDTALAAVDRQAALLGLALTRSESRAEGADSVIADVLPLLAAREPPCRIVWFIPCPTRRAVAVVSAAAGAIAAAYVSRTLAKQ